jgi:hypothetical protein
MVSAKQRGSGYFEEQAHGRADDRGVETVGSGAKGGRRGAGGGGVEAHDLSLEGEVRRDECEPSEEAKQLGGWRTLNQKQIWVDHVCVVCKGGL